MPVPRHPDHLTKTNSAEASSCTTIPRPSVLKHLITKKWSNTLFHHASRYKP
ncbi:hypothetical protein T4A_1856 [Trichinella pseudospiralis]|uniref:Uncharacterized protein n=1 Tax=Trichinella pseudospiralis TaxID=6337 RepID=A0A0V1CXH6_TRIPS|nr:hypothetical protein T4A_1856 [Trichinella pseudospiralis]